MNKSVNNSRNMWRNQSVQTSVSVPDMFCKQKISEVPLLSTTCMHKQLEQQPNLTQPILKFSKIISKTHHFYDTCRIGTKIEPSKKSDKNCQHLFRPTLILIKTLKMKTEKIKSQLINFPFL